MADEIQASSEEVLIGISSCLLGENVRFDGGHKLDSFLANTVARFVRFVRVCPEMEIGLPSPRESMRLLVDPESDTPRLVAPRSGLDHTVAMQRFSKRRARELSALEISGFILKKDSPSCGMERVRVYAASGGATRNGRGLFAAGLMDSLPLLPVEEEGRLQDPPLRENFYERVFGYRRLQRFFATRWRMADLVAFHTAEKLLLLAHHPDGYRELGRLVASAKSLPRSELEERYCTLFMTALKRKATPGRQANVMEHMLGHFSAALTPDDRAEMLAVVRDYRLGLVPLVVPLTLARHHVRVHGITYLQGQSYLDPHPKELMLRNHV